MKRCLVLAAALLFLSPILSRATTLAGFAFDDLCDRAEAICWARSVSSRSAMDTRDGVIYTTTTLRILEPVKGGTRTREVALRLPGGAVDGTRLTVPGFPTFPPDAEAILFLTGPDQTGHPWPVGMGQGVYPVVRDAAGRAKVALRPGINPSPLSKPTADRSAAPEVLPVEDFLQRVRERLGRSRPVGHERGEAAGSLK